MIEARVSDAEAHRLLKLAAELDAALASGTSLAQVRQAALEAGIHPEAFDAAAEVAMQGRPVQSGRSSSPWWVRVCLWGVPDRQAAMVYYWLFLGGLLATPGLVIFADVPNAAAIALGGFLTFALWSTSSAVRWLDKHGWTALK